MSRLELLAVVPIVVNAGAAVLPAVLAGVVSVTAMIVRPRQWGGLVRTRAGIAALLIFLVAISVVIAVVAFPADRARANPSQIDWAAVARDYLRSKAQGPAGQIPPASQPVIEPRKQAFIDRGDLLRTGYLGGDAPRGLREVWQWSDPNDVFAMYGASPAMDPTLRWIYGGTYSEDGKKTLGSVFCLEALTGKLRWTPVSEVPIGKGLKRPIFGIISSPAVTADGKYMIVGEGLHNDRNSALLCFDAITGEFRWRVQTPLHIESGPSIDGDVVVVGAGAIERVSDGKVPLGDNPGFVLAVRISDGKELWRFPVNDPEGSSAIADGILYVGAGMNGDEVVALRMGTDAELKAANQRRLIWRTPTPWPVVSSVTVTEDALLVGCGDGNFSEPGKNGAVVALDRKTGKILWRTSRAVTPGAVMGAIAVREKMAVFGVGNGEVVALDLSRKGAQLWRSTVSKSAAVTAGCAVTEKTIYVVSADGWLSLLETETGRLIERHFVNDSVMPGKWGMSIAGPIVGHGRVYVVSETGGVRAYTGTPAP